MTVLPIPESHLVSEWVATHLGHLVDGKVEPSRRFRGGQAAADLALEELDITGYAARRNEVWPADRRGATMLSPYIRHGLLTLPRVWGTVATAPSKDREKFRDELLWQEFSRHLYARAGRGTAAPLRFEPGWFVDAPEDPWAGDMACVQLAIDGLEQDGWLANQTRMWLASHWAVRHGADWTVGEDRFFRHLLDGSRAANRTGWQWTIGTVTGKPYGFSRWQVQKRAPGLCTGCPHRKLCPIHDWPEERTLRPVDAANAVGDLDGVVDVTAEAGPSEPVVDRPAEVVWLTAESLGDDDPALLAHPDLPAVFVFDEPLLAKLRLSGKRLVFLADCLTDLAHRRPLEVVLGDPATVLAGRPLATTFAPVPGNRRLRAQLDVAALHPWPWLRRPAGGPVTSFSAWRRGLG